MLPRSPRARGAVLAINGERLEPAHERGYAVIRRRWLPGDVVQLDLPMPVERVHAHPDVWADVGRMCLMRGPLVYCLEAVDNPSTAVRRARLPRDAVPVAVERPDLFGGIVSVVADGAVARADSWECALYQNCPTALDPARLTAIPYFLWANREPGAMAVWLAEC